MHFQCSICHDSLLRPPEGPVPDAFTCGPTAAAVLRCGHVFHDRCIRRWLHGQHQDKQQCPNCKISCRPAKLYPLYLTTEDLQQGSSPPPEPPSFVNDSGEVDDSEALRLINSLYNRLNIQKQGLTELAKAKTELESALQTTTSERDSAQHDGKEMEKELLSRIVAYQYGTQRLQDKLDQTDLRVQAKIQSYKDELNKVKSELELCRQTETVSQALAEAHTAIERQTVENRRHMSKEDLLTFVASIENKILKMSQEHCQTKEKLQQAKRVANQAAAQQSHLETQRWNLKKRNEKLEAEVVTQQSRSNVELPVVEMVSSEILIPFEIPSSDDLEMRSCRPSLISKKRKATPGDSSSNLRRSSSSRMPDGLGGTKKVPFVRREALRSINNFIVDLDFEDDDDEEPPPTAKRDIRSLLTKRKTSL